MSGTDLGEALGDLIGRAGNTVREGIDRAQEAVEDFCEDPIGTTREVISNAADEISDSAQEQYNAALELRREAREYRDTLDARIAALQTLESFLSSYIDSHDTVRIGLSEEPFNTSSNGDCDHWGSGSGVYMQDIYDEFTDSYDGTFLQAVVQNYVDEIESLKRQVTSNRQTLQQDRSLYDGMKWLTPFGWILI